MSKVFPAFVQTKLFSQNWRYLPLLILLIGFLLRMLVFHNVTGHPERFFQNDSRGYHSLALNLLESQQFEADFWGIDVRLKPFYVLFLTTVYTIFGTGSAAVIVWQIFISTLTLALAYRLGRLWVNFRTGVIVAALMSIEVGSIFYANQMMTETLFSVILLGGVVIWGVMIQRRQWQYGLLVGVVFGLNTFVRPIMFYLGGVLVLLTLFLWSGSSKKRWLAALSVAFAFVLTISLGMIRNYSITQEAQLNSAQAQFLIYNVRQLLAAQQGITVEAAQDQFLEEAQQEISQTTPQDSKNLDVYYQKKSLTLIQDYWVDYMLLHLKGSVMFFVVPTAGVAARLLGWIRDSGTGLLSNLFSRSIRDTWQSFQNFFFQLGQANPGGWWFFGVVGYELLYLGLINIAAVWGGIECLKNRRWNILLPPVVIIGYFALITGPLSYDARFRVPIMPFLILLAAMAPLPELRFRSLTKSDD